MHEFNFFKYNYEPNDKCEHLVVETVDITSKFMFFYVQISSCSFLIFS